MGEIKIAKLGRSVENVPTEKELTVQEALETATITWNDCEIRINGETAKLETLLVDGDIVTLVPKIKGGK